MLRVSEATGAPVGYCEACGEYTESPTDAEQSRCCDARMHSHEPEGWNLYLKKELPDGKLARVLHGNYGSKKEADDNGLRLRLLYPWIKSYEAEPCFDAGVQTEDKLHVSRGLIEFAGEVMQAARHAAPGDKLWIIGLRAQEILRSGRYRRVS